MSPHPRPILKRTSSPMRVANNALPFSSCGQIMSPHVHFPPTPALVSTHPAHPPEIYDRAPIVVSPNICEIPDRNDRRPPTPAPPRFEIEQDRGRSRHCTPRQEENVKGSYFHPRAYEACEPEPVHNYLPSTPLRPPPLVRDISPDEVDDMIATPPDVHIPASAWSPLPKADLSPIFGDVDVSSHHDRSSFDSARSSQSWFATADSKKYRPNLARREKQRPLKRMKECPSSQLAVDEGCLAGF